MASKKDSIFGNKGIIATYSNGVQIQPKGGEKITQPGQSTSVGEALRRYTAGTYSEQVQHYYDSLVGLDPNAWPQGLPVDVNKLPRIEQMTLLNQLKEEYKDQFAILQQPVVQPVTNGNETTTSEGEANTDS